MKKREWKQADRPWLLAVEDPQQLGRDIGSGTYNIRNVQHLFAAAAATLRDCMEQQTEDQQWASVQVCLTDQYRSILCVQCCNSIKTIGKSTHGYGQQVKLALCTPLAQSPADGVMFQEGPDEVAALPLSFQ